MLNENFSYRTIVTGLRPPKVSTLIYTKDEDWIDTSIRIIEYYSQLWGGNYNLIIPTDGKKIDDIFLDILKEYDPDYIFRYSKSLLDLKYIDSKKYLEIIPEQMKKGFPGWSEDKKNEWIDKQAAISDYDNFEISEELKQKLLEELNPFYERDNFIASYQIGADQKPNYPLTNIIEIFKSSNFQKIIDFKIEDSKVLKLLGYSIIGSARCIKSTTKEDYNTKEIFKLTPEIFEEKIIERKDINNFFDFIYKDKYSSEYDKMKEEHQFVPFVLNMKNLVPLKLVGNKKTEKNDSVVVVVGDKLEDFCLYYNLQKLKEDALWLPYKLIEKEGLINDFLLKMYMVITEKATGRNNNKDIVFTSVSLDQGKIKDILKIYKKHKIVVENDKEIISKDLDILMPDKNFVFEKDNYTNINVEPFLGNKSINFINIPLPRGSNFNLQKIDPLEFRWITEIRVGTRKSGNMDRGYILPLKRVFSNYLFDKSVWNSYTRVSNEGISLCSPYLGPAAWGDSITNIVNINRPRIKVLDDYDIFKIMFNDIGYSINLSDKGKYLAESINKIGSLENLAKMILDNRQFSLLERFKEGVTGEFDYKINDRLYIEYSTIKNIFDVNAEDIIDEYIKKNIFYRGFIFMCSRCNNTDWYSISEVSDIFKCKRCSNVQLFLKDNWKLKGLPSEPRWHFKLDEVFFQGLKNNMHVTVLTLNKLLQDCKRSFIYIPEIEIFYNNDVKSKKELDICCLCDGRIIFGECKTNDQIGKTEKEEKERLKFLGNLFLKLRANKILFSTYSNNWRDKTLELIGSFFREYGLVYNKNDLTAS